MEASSLAYWSKVKTHVANRNGGVYILFWKNIPNLPMIFQGMDTQSQPSISIFFNEGQENETIIAEK